MSNYNRKPLPWGGELGIPVEDCHTSKEVMEKAGLNFYVDKCELVARMPININGDNTVNETMGDFAYNGNIYRDCPNAYATYRVDRNIPLGLVKSQYTVVQNIEAFNFFDDAIGPNKAIWQTAGCFGYGHRIFVSAKLPVETDVNGDLINNYLVFTNSHDGSMSVDIMFTPVRMFCFNMLAGAKQSAKAHIRIKHTKSAKERLQRGTEVLRIACQYATEAQQLYDSLYTIKMSDDAVIEYLMKLNLTEDELYNILDYDKLRGFDRLLARDRFFMEQTNISTRKANKIASMFDYYKNGIGQREIMGNAWGAYNAVTGYYSNVDNVTGEKRLNSLLYGNGQSSINDAFVSAMALAEAV